MANDEKLKDIVRDSYGKIAAGNSCGCGCGGSAEKVSKNVGYSTEEIGAVPEGANLGLGCGNPVVLASLKEGERVLDLGSGAGFDCFLAANRVGKSGKVIGVDMTPEMVEKARKNASKGGYENVEFRQGEIESLPVDDNSVDVVISNCVINLSPEKEKVFAETFRVLAPGGRLAVSDIVLLKELPAPIRKNSKAYVSCVSGAILKDRYLEMMKDAGFEDVQVVSEVGFSVETSCCDPTTQMLIDELALPPEVARELAGAVVSVKVEGKKG